MLDIIHVSRDERLDSPSGIDAWYIRLGDTGVKCYHFEDTRDRAVRNQKRLGKYAPRVIRDKVTVLVREQEYYAYETEHVETRTDGSKAEFQRLADKLRVQVEMDLGVTWVDSHSGNIGIVDGRPVIIDCADKLFADDRVGVTDGHRT